MVLKMAHAAVVAVPQLSRYWIQIGVTILAIVIVRAFAQGRSTTRERDLHARVILVTGGFTHLGLTLLQSLAERGAHIIALSPEPITTPSISILIELLRSTTSNENIFAEECDLSSPNSIKDFCTRFLTGQDQRLDALVFGHEYQIIGSVVSSKSKSILDREREEASLATFLIITLLLPALLVAPVERDIRIINMINPFYAAAVPTFAPSNPLSDKSSSIFIAEGHRSLRMALFTRHLQRVLDALPSDAQVPKTDESMTGAVPVVSEKTQRSNIVAVSVSPGISRSDTIAPLLNAETKGETKRSTTGLILYIILQPFLRILTKSTSSALQSVLHTLFLPTPFKLSNRKSTTPKSNSAAHPEEALKPGALYSDCAIVNLKVPSPPDPLPKAGDEGKVLEDDGELGGEVAGRLVWEGFENGLKAWEKANPPPPPPPSKEEKGEGSSEGTTETTTAK